MGIVRWHYLILLILGWASPLRAEKTPEQLQLWWQPTLVHLASGYQGQWRWQNRTWTTVAVTRGTGVLVHPNGLIVTPATVVQSAWQGEEYGKQLLLEHLARQRLELHNQAFPDAKIPLTPANLEEAVTLIRATAQLEQFERLNEVFLSGGKADQSYGFRLQRYDAQRNLALLAVDLTQTPTLVWQPVPRPPAGTTLYVLTQPDPQVHPNSQWQKGTWNNPSFRFSNPSGLTGGILVLTSGEVVGLAASAANQVTLIASDTIRQFLQQAGVENQESPVNRRWQEGLTYFWQAHYRRARPVLQEVLEQYPQHYSAQALLAEATERIDRGQDRSPVAWWQVGLVGGGIGILVLGAGAVGFAMWLSRHPRRVPPVQGIVQPPTGAADLPTLAVTGWEDTSLVSPPTLPLGESLPPDPLEPASTQIIPPAEPPTQVLKAPPEPETQILTPPAQVPVTEAYRPSRLVGLSGPVQGEEFTLVGSHYLGRDSQRCQIVIPDPQVSGQHAHIEVTPTHVILRDCGSTNGTFINNVLYPRVTEVQLQDQDVIILGQKGTVKFRFHA